MNILDNKSEYFSEIPVEIASLVINECDHHQLPHLTSVCKLWNDIIVENENYRDFKISKSFTVASTWTDHPEKSKKEWFDGFVFLKGHLILTAYQTTQKNLKDFSGMDQNKLLNLSGVIIKEASYSALFIGFTPLIYILCDSFYNEKFLFCTKKLLGMGAKVNVATCIETSPYAFSIDKQCYFSLEKHTTPLWAAAVVAKNLDAVLCLKSHGGIVHPKFDPIEHEDAIVLLKEADDILYGKPVRLVEGFKSKNSILSKLPRNLISHIGAIYMSLYK